MNQLINGECLEQLRLLPDNSIDSVVTDPPAGIGFMGKGWDSDKGGRKQWIEWLCSVFVEVRRVLKPGGHCLVWALPRTSHWTGTALEDAGFEVRDVVHHIFGSGFPKSLNIGKAVDKLQENERETIREEKEPARQGGNTPFDMRSSSSRFLDKGTSEWEGWGTALKPAVECWWLVRKPLSENTVAENVLKWGTGGINIDQSRVEITDKENYDFNNNGASRLKKEEGENLGMYSGGWKVDKQIRENNLGRFPANLTHDGSDEVVAEFPQTGVSKWGKLIQDEKPLDGFLGALSGGGDKNRCDKFIGDSGSASRFFYCAKPSQAEKNKGLEGCEDLPLTNENRDNAPLTSAEGRVANSHNSHPTVKSLSLMRYLIKLITPPNGTVLDMFAGSGTTICAAKQLGMNYIGIEQNEEYIKIAEARIKAWDVLEPTEAFPDCLEPFETANNKTKLTQQNLF